MTAQVKIKKTSVTRKEQVEATKSTILEAAINLFLENGYKAASLNVLTKKIGCSKDTIYKRFGNKEGLFIATVDNILETVLLDISGEEIQSMPLREGLEQASIRTLEKVCNPRYLKLRLLISANTDEHPKIGQKFYERIEKRSYNVLGAFFQHHIDQKALLQIDAQQMAKYFWGMMLHNLLFQLDCKERPEISNCALRTHSCKVIDDFLMAFSR